MVGSAARMRTSTRSNGDFRPSGPRHGEFPTGLLSPGPGKELALNAVRLACGSRQRMEDY